MAELPPPFGDFYREIYAKGMFADERPTLPMAWAELDLTMALSGATSPDQLDRSFLRAGPEG